MNNKKYLNCQNHVHDVPLKQNCLVWRLVVWYKSSMKNIIWIYIVVNVLQHVLCIKVAHKMYVSCNVTSRGVFTCSILASIVIILSEYCDNTYKYWPNTWKMCSPACVILTSIGTILVSFWRNLKRNSANINFRG